jgi:hypothetical protein
VPRHGLPQVDPKKAKADSSQKAKTDSAQPKTGPTSSGKGHVVPPCSNRFVAPLRPGKTPGDAAQPAEFEKLMMEMTEASPGTQSCIQLCTSDQIKEIASEDFVRWALSSGRTRDSETRQRMGETCRESSRHFENVRDSRNSRRDF